MIVFKLGNSELLLWRYVTDSEVEKTERLESISVSAKFLINDGYISYMVPGSTEQVAIGSYIQYEVVLPATKF